jgi:hypothetical protein
MYTGVGRRALMVCTAFLIMLTAGCDREPVTVWSGSTSSPDGQWIAKAHTDQIAGPGINAVATIVELQQTSNRTIDPTVILGMTNASAYPLGATAVQMHWNSNTSLEVSYPYGAKVNFQAALASGITITAHTIPQDARAGQ